MNILAEIHPPNPISESSAQWHFHLPLPHASQNWFGGWVGQEQPQKIMWGRNCSIWKAGILAQMKSVMVWHWPPDPQQIISIQEIQNRVFGITQLCWRVYNRPELTHHGGQHFQASLLTHQSNQLQKDRVKGPVVFSDCFHRDTEIKWQERPLTSSSLPVQWFASFTADCGISYCSLSPLYL